jgi:hypothetical protein
MLYVSHPVLDLIFCHPHRWTSNVLTDLRIHNTTPGENPRLDLLRTFYFQHPHLSVRQRYFINQHILYQKLVPLCSRCYRETAIFFAAEGTIREKYYLLLSRTRSLLSQDSITCGQSKAYCPTCLPRKVLKHSLGYLKLLSNGNIETRLPEDDEQSESIWDLCAADW